jgi:hypothetical protein
MKPRACSRPKQSWFRRIVQRQPAAPGHQCRIISDIDAPKLQWQTFTKWVRGCAPSWAMAADSLSDPFSMHTSSPGQNAGINQRW